MLPFHNPLTISGTDGGPHRLIDSVVTCTIFRVLPGFALILPPDCIVMIGFATIRIDHATILSDAALVFGLSDGLEQHGGNYG